MIFHHTLVLIGARIRRTMSGCSLHVIHHKHANLGSLGALITSWIRSSLGTNQHSSVFLNAQLSHYLGHLFEGLNKWRDIMHPLFQGFQHICSQVRRRRLVVSELDIRVVYVDLGVGRYILLFTRHEPSNPVVNASMDTKVTCTTACNGHCLTATLAPI